MIRVEEKLLECQAIKVSHDGPLKKILGEGIYAHPQVHAEYDDHMLSLCRKASLNSWDNIPDPGELLEAYFRIHQGPTESKSPRDNNRRAWEGETPYRDRYRYQEARVHHYYEPEPHVGRAHSRRPQRH